jgi:hypothetical protein
LTAAASLATNTRKMARRGWGEPRHLGQRSKGPDLGLARQVRVSRRTGVCGDAAAGALKDEANKGKNKRGARALVKVAAPARDFPTRHKDRLHMAASEAARECSG